MVTQKLVRVIWQTLDSWKHWSRLTQNILQLCEVTDISDEQQRLCLVHFNFPIPKKEIRELTPFWPPPRQPTAHGCNLTLWPLTTFTFWKSFKVVTKMVRSSNVQTTGNMFKTESQCYHINANNKKLMPMLMTETGSHMTCSWVNWLCCLIVGMDKPALDGSLDLCNAPSLLFF